MMYTRQIVTIGILFYASVSMVLHGQEVQMTDSESQPFRSGSSTVVVIPDTQGYASSDEKAAILQGMMKWIVSNADSRNIKNVVHVGDMTNANSKEQWQRIRDCYTLLDDELAYVICEGNHDTKKKNGKYNDYMNSFFRLDQNKRNGAAFQGAFESGKLQNVFYEIRLCGQDFLFLALESSPRNSVLDWANEVISNHSSHHIFITVHDYLDEASRLVSADGQPVPVKTKEYLAAKGRNSGIDIYKKLIERHSNVEFLVCGHAGALKIRGEKEPLTQLEAEKLKHKGAKADDLREFFKHFVYDPDIATGHRSDTLVNQSIVHQILFNAQWVRDDTGQRNGGDGWLLLMEFQPDNQSVRFKTYSPHLNRWRTGEEYSYELSRSVWP